VPGRARIVAILQLYGEFEWEFSDPWDLMRVVGYLR
jgi:hypothetical protein